MFGEHVISRAVWLAHVRRRRYMGGARERASRCRRPGFHECLNRGCGGSIRGESLQETRCSRRPLVPPHLLEATTRYLFGQRDLFDVYSTYTHALPMFIRHTYLFKASMTDAYTDCCIPIMIDIDRKYNLFALSSVTNIASPRNIIY